MLRKKKKITFFYSPENESLKISKECGIIVTVFKNLLTIRVNISAQL